MNRTDSDQTLPPVERAAIGSWLRLSGAWSSPPRLLRIFARDSNALIDLMDDIDVDFASQRPAIARLTGLPKAACNWSLYMVLDHLAKCDREFLLVIRQLCEGMEPFGGFSPARCIPDDGAGAGSVADFESSAREFAKSVSGLLPLPPLPRWDHPWFGPLGPRGWLAVAAHHQRVHRRQARKIITVLGVA